MVASRAPQPDDEEWLPPLVELSDEEYARLFDEAVRQQLGMSGAEFIRRYDAGEYDAVLDSPGHLHIGFLGSMIPREAPHH